MVVILKPPNIKFAQKRVINNANVIEQFLLDTRFSKSLNLHCGGFGMFPVC